MSQDLNKLFQEIRNRQVNEEFEVGQAAQALFELKKAVNAYNEFVNGEFDKMFKSLHRTTRDRTDQVHEASKALENATKELKSVADEVSGYLFNLDTYDNPESDFDGKHRTGRWKRWEHRPTRNQQKEWDREDGI